MKAGEKAYVGIAPCGCVRAAHCHEESSRNEVAEFCSQVIRDGLSLERMTVEEVRAAEWGCEKCDRWVQEQLQTSLELEPAGSPG